MDSILLFQFTNISAHITAALIQHHFLMSTFTLYKQHPFSTCHPINMR
nr:MAG TPA: hypothetical protein [Caudoviricetes sp.]DAN60396.1 MAG TPA: hypothetical protein [Caudoviricetes sp.]